MEEVLDIYTRPYDQRHPQVCLDETSKQLVNETRVPIPAEPGRVERFDYEYERQGVCSLFMCFEPLAGRRHVMVSAHRAKQDFAHVLRDLVDIHYPNAEKIILVLDNLNTHDFSALYEVFELEEAWRIREKIEIRYTPKHGSWLNMAEIELAVLSGQCLDRRIGEEETLRQEIAAWEAERNEQQVRVNWRFTTQDARIKLKRLYLVLEQGDWRKRPFLNLVERLGNQAELHRAQRSARCRGVKKISDEKQLREAGWVRTPCSSSSEACGAVRLCNAIGPLTQTDDPGADRENAHEHFSC
jgi:hypothetical protein